MPLRKLFLPATHHDPTSCPDGGEPTWRHTTGNWRRIDFVALPLRWLCACYMVSLPFRIKKITGLLRWIFPFSSLVLVFVSQEISLPGEHLSSQMLLSAQKPFGGQCLAGPIIGTLTEWKLLLPSWLASFLQLWLRLKRGAQKQIGSRQTLGPIFSCTENVGINSLRGSGSASPFSCGLPFGLGALPPLTRLGKRRQTSVLIVWSLHCKRVFCSLLQSRQQRRLKQTVVLGCAAKPSAFKRISTMVCPLSL